ncbi:MAG TPA: xanthine dehydrogenase family protein molybdopterin-binding subunit [Roseiarcus sp.]|jgi:carbon-monoxide dehydrogenase large subunit|nr:xanthine dehydrogenase family protein molybdopterin-binding subunit [Roseiarcus sp.]
MKPTKFGVGQSVKRVEDIRLVSGRGNYASDAVDQAELKAVFLRSPYGHAKFRVDDVEASCAAPGVRAVYVASDFADLGDLPCLAPVPNGDGSKTPLKPYPIMAADETHHVGDIVAMVVADTALQARDAVELISLTWEDLPAVTDMEAALQPDAPLVFAGAPGNVAYDTHIGDKQETDKAFAGAAHTVRIRIVNPRAVANYMEPRSAVGEYDAQSGRFTLNAGSQGVHILQGLIANQILKIPSANLRVVTQDVGGGFGTKNMLYREYPLVLEAARRLGRSVGWLADRGEHFVGDAQGRDNVTTAEMALDSVGRFMALRVDILGNLGGYLSMFAPYIPWLGASMASGCYHIDALYARVRGIYTHTVPVDAYRGAGRPEAAYVLERLVDACAHKLGIAPEELRARNFVKPDQMPYHTHTDRDYDVGDFEGAMRACLKKADQSGFKRRAEDARARGKIRGFGFASYVECTAWGEGEEGSVGLERNGDFIVLIGTQSTGQGHETAYAQIVAQYLDVPIDRIKVVQGDTDRIPTGNGTGGSRSIPIGAVMVSRASETLVGSLKELAADKLEAAVADLEIADGKVRIAGTDRAISYSEIASLPGAAAKLIATDSFVPPSATYPNGTHACEVEIDPDTGETTIVRYSVVDDFGFTLNPLLLAGQVHGGIAQGAGQALMERAVFDDHGQLLTASFLDYCMPRADNLPQFDFETRNVPSTTNPMGLKGAGEAGSIGSTPAVMNAVADALWRAYRIEHIDMPATPFAVYSAIRGSSVHA